MRPAGLLSEQYAFKSPLKRFCAALLDLTGNLLFFPFRRKPQMGGIKKILAVRLDHLGDVVMTRPAIAALHDQLPNVQIDLLVSSEMVPLFEDAREVREIIGFQRHWFRRRPSLPQSFLGALEMIPQIRSRNYDLAIDFRGDLRTLAFLRASGISKVIGYGVTGGSFLLSDSRPYDWNKHQTDLNLELLSCLGLQKDSAQEPFAYSGSRKWRFWNSLGKELNAESRFRAVIHPGAGLPEKRWPENNFKELIGKLSELPGVEIVLIGTADEKQLDVIPAGAPVKDFRGRTELRDLPVLFDSCHLFIGNDSGPAHVAAAQGVTVLSIFSSENDPEVWKPRGRKPVEILLYRSGADEKITPELVFEKAGALLRTP